MSEVELTPPKPITEFLDDLHASGQQIVPGSLVWLPHPTRPGLMVAAVIVNTSKESEEK